MILSFLNSLEILSFIEKDPNEWKVTFDNLVELSEWSSVSGIIFVFLILILLFFIHRERKWFWNIADRCLSSAFVVVWLLGFVVYDIGMYTGERP